MNKMNSDTVKDAERAAYAAASQTLEAAAQRDEEVAGDLSAYAVQSDLAAHAAVGDKMRRQADSAQLRLALHDLTEGIRGMIRAAPLSSVFLGVAIGVALSKRGIHRATKSPRA